MNLEKLSSNNTNTSCLASRKQYLKSRSDFIIAIIDLRTLSSIFISNCEFLVKKVSKICWATTNCCVEFSYCSDSYCSTLEKKKRFSDEYSSNNEYKK